MRMFRVLGALLLFAAPLAAQGTNPVNSRSLTAVAVSCTASSTGCLIVGTTGAGGLGVDIRGTFTATVQFEGLVSSDTTKTWVAVNCTPYDSTTAVTSTTAAGSWGCAVGGLSFFRVRVSAYTSGTINAATRTATTLARGSAGGGFSVPSGWSWDATAVSSETGVFITGNTVANMGTPLPSFGVFVGDQTYGGDGAGDPPVQFEFTMTDPAAYSGIESYVFWDTGAAMSGDLISTVFSNNFNGDFDYTNGGVLDATVANAFYGNTSGHHTISRLINMWSGSSIGSGSGDAITVNEFAEFWAETPSILGTTSIGTLYGYYAKAFGGSATNAYSFWSDEQGVYRIKSDNTFNTVYQAIPALYNPQFTKYTAGSANYERIVQQWESNVAVLTTEKGGTGTLRDLQIGDANVHVRVSDLKNTGSATGKKVVCVDTATGQLYASSTGTDCSN